MQIVRYKELSSTNLHFHELLKKGKPEEGAIIITENQTAGRGQAGNYWESEPGKNLTFSIILYPEKIKANEQFIISQITALSLKNVLDTYISGITIKWPNDIYFQNKKIAGILIENSLTANAIDSSIIGIGLNVNQEIFHSNAPNPVSLKQITGVDFDLDHLLQQIQTQILTIYKKTDPEEIKKNYVNSLYRKTGLHHYADKEGIFLASIHSIDLNGRLILEKENGEKREYAFKEVLFV